MTVETRWSGVTVTDWLEGEVPSTEDGSEEETRSGGSRSTLVRVLTGTGVARLEFAPRPEFGQVSVRLQPLGDGLLVLGSNEPMILYAAGVEWDVFDDGGTTPPTPSSTSRPRGDGSRSSCASAPRT